MKKAILILSFLGTFIFGDDLENSSNSMAQILTKKQILQKYQNAKPQKWGENLDGVIKNFKTDEKIVALTLDLCGSKTDGLDDRIVNFLEENSIKATFFVNLRWIEKFPDEFRLLSQNPLWQIENHGTSHRPASLNGNQIYGIKGTANSAEFYDEVMINADKIEQISSKRPKFYRSGTAYYDEFALSQLADMGFSAIGFSILGDAGATYSANDTKIAVSSAKGGDIIIAHANRPEKPSGEGVVDGLKILLENGFKFARLDEVLK